MLDITVQVGKGIIQMSEELLGKVIVEYKFCDKKEELKDVFLDFTGMIHSMFNKEVRFRVYSNNIRDLHSILSIPSLATDDAYKGIVFNHMEYLEIEEVNKGSGYYVDYDSLDILAEVVFGKAQPVLCGNSRG